MTKVRGMSIVGVAGALVVAGAVWAADPPAPAGQTTPAKPAAPAATATPPAPKPAPAAKPAAPTAAKPTAAAKPAAKAEAAAKGPVRSIIGEVVDPACWIVNGSKGEGHRECAVACAKAGQTLAIVEKKSGKLYVVAGERPGEDPNKGLVDYVAQTVFVKGKVFSRGGALGIKIQSVEPYKAP